MLGAAESFLFVFLKGLLSQLFAWAAPEYVAIERLLNEGVGSFHSTLCKPRWQLSKSLQK